MDEASRQTMQAAFDDILKVRKDVLDTLLTTTADRDMFRKVYPFSPALVQTLIAVSAALQRERTALKLMLQLLVDRRADLELGQLIPVGDLYDAIAEGDEPFSEGMRLHFENAKRLYTQRMLPMLANPAPSRSKWMGKRPNFRCPLANGASWTPPWPRALHCPMRVKGACAALAKQNSWKARLLWPSITDWSRTRSNAGIF